MNFSLRELLDHLRADLRKDTERGKLVRSAFLTSSLKIMATLIAFVASLLYARALGPHDYGLYAYVMAWVTVLTIPASFGIPNYLVREGAKAPENIGLLRRWADKRVLIGGLLASLLLVCAYFVPAAAGARWLFVLASPIPLLTNFSAVRQSLLQAHGWIIRSQWPQLIFAPTLTLLLLFLLWLWRDGFRPSDVVIATVVAAVIQCGINICQLERATIDSNNARRYLGTRMKAALPFMWIGALYLVMSRIDLILLGSLKGARDAGIYAIASRAAEFVPFFLVATNTTIAPKISNLYHAHDHKSLQRLTTGVVHRLFWSTLPLVIILVVAAHPLIKFFYGGSFEEGASALQILAVAQFTTILAGPVGVLLNMTEHASLSAKTFSLGAAINIIFNLILIPKYGYTGAAISTSISIIFSNGYRWHLVRHFLKLRPSIFGI